MRGAHVGGHDPRPARRIIPADAGSTVDKSLRPPHVRDHLRGCGEHWSPGTAPSMVAGSSPRMRGARRISGDYPRMVGIIPADAGSTDGTAYYERRVRDHPRGCGEHVLPIYMSVLDCGSSPRMRGARLETIRSHAAPGIIPADAGSTRTPLVVAMHSWDHPRGCGEHKRYKARGNTPTGSSPRMRGALTPSASSPPWSRIIPADAGSTGV